MDGYQGFSNTDWARSLSTTIANHIREEEHAWMKNYQILALLESNGRILFNQSGRGFDWPVRFKVHAIEGNNGETPRNFVRTNLWKTAALPYRGYQATDSIFRKELLENRGEAAIVNIINGFVKRLEDSMKFGLATEPYIDGNATGNELLWHGLESMFAINGTLKYDDGTQRAANGADIVGYPSDVYAGLNTELGHYGGENEVGSVWPFGVADPEFDFWSPLVVNYTTTHAALPSSTNTWVGQGLEAMRFAILHSQRNSSMEGQITNIILNRSMYGDCLNAMDDKEQINVTSENELRALGFKNTFVYDGVTVSWEGAVPTGVGYGLNYNNIEIRSMEDTLIKAEEVEFDQETQAFNGVVYTLSNLKFSSPRNFFKLAALA